jgi:hypothetical protein
MVTEWNVKRIVLVAGALVLVMASLIFVINNDPQKTDSVNEVVQVKATDKQETPELAAKEPELRKSELSGQLTTEAAPSSELKKEPVQIKKESVSAESGKKQLKKKIPKEHEHFHVVSRSLLTYGINNKEPAGEIAGSLKVSGKKPTWVYYFTELKAMKGSRVYHEWLKNGSLVSRQSIVISGDTWRTSSRKLLSESDKGKWTVRMVDENNRLLNEKTIKVE